MASSETSVKVAVSVSENLYQEHRDLTVTVTITVTEFCAFYAWGIVFRTQEYLLQQHLMKENH
jgi:hypothetical protein